MTQPKLILVICLLCLWSATDAQIISTYAGNDTAGFREGYGPATAAEFLNPSGIALDAAGNLYIADTYNNRVRKVSPAGIILTIAGIGVPGYMGDGGPASSAMLFSPKGVTVDIGGNVYIADYGNNCIRRIDTSGLISTIAGNYAMGYGFSGDGGAATLAQMSGPVGMVIDDSGNLYIADNLNYRVRVVNRAGLISTFAGNGYASYSGDGGPAVDAEFDVRGLAADHSGNIYIADNSSSSRIRKIARSGVISTIAGNNTRGYTGDGGPASAAELYYVSGVAVDGSGNVLVADVGNNCVRRINDSGIITTIAGTGVSGSSGDGGPATAARLALPMGLATAGTDVIFISDIGTNTVRRIGPPVSAVAPAPVALWEPMRIWPDPGNGNFKLFLPPVATAPCRVVITDAWGHTVSNQMIVAGQVTEMSLNVPPGDYLVTAICGQAAQSRKIVVHP